MTVRIEHLFNAPVDRVWAAITRWDEMVQWYFENIPEFRAEVGFQTSFTVMSDERPFTHIWKVTSVVPGREITYQWNFAEYEGTGSVHFLLAPEGKDTLLTLTNEGLETFPRNVPEFTRESCIAGWGFFIKDRLAKYLIDQG
jgi:uncharacterized protein YndB with AHSA1/START domain